MFTFQHAFVSIYSHKLVNNTIQPTSVLRFYNNFIFSRAHWSRAIVNKSITMEWRDGHGCPFSLILRIHASFYCGVLQEIRHVRNFSLL